jgi:hypothetical protein
MEGQVMDEDVDKRQVYIDKKAKDLGKAAAAGEFVQSKGGQNLIDWIQAQVNLFTNDLLSDKFINDHNGYLDARAKVSFGRNIIATLTKLSNPDLEAALRKEIEAAQAEGEGDG